MFTRGNPDVEEAITDGDEDEQSVGYVSGHGCD